MRERKKTNGLTPAITASLLMHGLVFFCLGAAGTSGPTAEPSIMITYLAMPAPVPVRAHVRKTAPEKKADPPAEQSRPASPATEKPRRVASKPVVPEAILKEKPQPEPALSEEIKTQERSEENVAERQQQFEIDAPEPLVSAGPVPGSSRGLNYEASSKDNSDGGNQIPGKKDLTDHRSPITGLLFVPLAKEGHQESLLAFAGDPASLGMILPGVPGPELVEAEILSLPEPAYPVLSRKRGEEGRVIIQVEISAEGEVLKAQVADSSSYPRLDRAALKAIRNATFVPAIEFGMPVESTTKVAYRFKLEKR